MLGRMSRDGVVRHHLDQLTEEDLAGAIRCSDSRLEASGGCPNSETADADLNQIAAAAACGHRSSLCGCSFPIGFAGPSALTRVLRRMEHHHVLHVR